MNESRASRYHRLERRTAHLGVALVAGVLLVLLLAGWSIRLRDWAGGSPAIYVLLVMAVLEIVRLPLAWWRWVQLERPYALGQPSARGWSAEYAATRAVEAIALGAAAELISASIRFAPRAWWAIAACAATALVVLLAAAGPVLVRPVSRRRPLPPGPLRARLEDLCRRAGRGGVELIEYETDGRGSRADAALAGAFGRPRVLLSTRLLADYSHDEIAAVLAHELGHIINHDLRSGLAALALLVWIMCGVAWAALAAGGPAVALDAPHDPAGLPLVALAAGAAALCGTPLLRALSRRAERRADRVALALVGRPDAFISAVRRMAAAHLAEERPSRTAVWLFHSHPSVEERIACARGYGQAEAVG